MPTRKRTYSHSTTAMSAQLAFPDGQPPADRTYLSIELRLLDPTPHALRETLDPDDLAHLAASIHAHGVLQPLIVRPAGEAGGDRYQVIAGERRRQAALIAGLAAAPCVVYALSDDDVALIAILENTQRADLTPLDEARAYAELVRQRGLALRDVAAIVHKSHEVVRLRLALLDAPAVAAAVHDGRLTLTRGQQLALVSDPTARAALLDQAARGPQPTLAAVKRAQATGRRRAGGDDGDAAVNYLTPAHTPAAAAAAGPAPDSADADEPLITLGELAIVRLATAARDGTARRADALAALRADLAHLRGATP